MSEQPEDRLARLLREHGAALSRLAAVYEWDQHERQDLLQEIALAVWRALPSFRGESSERTFVFRIAHNRGLSHRWRQRRSHLNLEQAGELQDQKADSEAKLARREQHERLAAAIRKLPDSHRAAVILTLEGLTQREVAEVLGAKENTIAMRLTRSRRMLRELLGEEGPST